MGDLGSPEMADNDDFELEVEEENATLDDIPADIITTVPSDVARMAEAIIFASEAPVSNKALHDRLPDGTDLAAVIAELQAFYRLRGVNLIRVDDHWAFRTAGDLAFLMSREQVKPKKLSRAALEVLSTIAYHQPVTRAEIEDVRGVDTSKGTLDLLMETGWVRLRGRRRTPGRPVTYGTTVEFLDHFGLETLRELPGVDELKGAGLLSGSIPSSFAVPAPPDDPDLLGEDEDPLTDVDLEELGLLAPKG